MQKHREWHSRGYLPHFDHPGLLQTVTFRLNDALPRAVLERLDRESLGDGQRRRHIEAYLDAGHGACVLRRPEIGAMVENALLHFDGRRYRLLAWCVMPNHVHTVLELLSGWPLDQILHSWKSFTANQANRLLGQTGRLWQAEYFDRFIRDQNHLEAAIAYVHNNPVRAGLAARAEEWPYSSARFPQA